MSSAKQTNQTAIVIGSGFGGLAAAIRLQIMGFSTKILEKRDKPGGRAYQYNLEGYKFDAGPTVITAPECLEELFTLAGKALKDYVTLIPVDPMYELCWEDGTRFSYIRDHESLKKEIARISPQDVDGYEKFLAYAEEVYAEGYEKLCHYPFLNFSDMIKVAPKLLKLQAHQSVYKKVSSFIKNDKLRQAFSFNSLLIGGNPFSTSSIYTLIHPLEKKWGVFFAKGGTHALVHGLVKLFQDLGGTIELDTPVSSVKTHDKQVVGVETPNGFRPADLVVCNSDVVHTYKDLLADNKYAKRKAKKLINSQHSMSLFVLYFGTNKQYTNLAHHSVLLGNRYKELLDDIFTNGVIADDFSLYLHAPTRTDASLAPTGCDAFYALAPVPNMIKNNTNWEAFAPEFASRILTYLEKHYMPGLKDALTVQRHFTPEDFTSELNAYKGAAFSLAPTLTQSAWFRPHNVDETISNLYFVGAGTHPGAGVPGVVGSAKATAQIIYEDRILKRTMSMEERITAKGYLCPQC